MRRTPPRRRPGEAVREYERRLRAAGCSRAEARRLASASTSTPPPRSMLDLLRWPR